METATFGGGCFWCTEAVFQRIRGVSEVVSGYAGGEVSNPTYEQVCGGATGHAEVIRVTFDPAVVSFEVLLEVFFYTHDPTTKNRQGNDVGTQYRSVVFYENEAQRDIATALKTKLDESGEFAASIVTEIEPAPEFFAAEAYHQDFFRRNPSQPYCAAVVHPKVDKFLQRYGDTLS